MALTKRGINYSLLYGIDTKTDEKLISAGKLSVLENSVFKQTGKVNKRNGEDPLSIETTDGYQLTSCLSIAKLQDQLCMFSKQYLYSYIGATDRWLKAGDIPTAVIKNTPIVSNNGVQFNGDITTNSEVTTIGWLDTLAGTTSVKATVINQQDNSVLVPTTQLLATGTGVKTISLGYYSFIFAVSGNTMYGYRISVSNPTISTPYQVFTDVSGTNQHFDIAISGTHMVITYVDTSGDIIVSYVTQNLDAGSPLLGLPSPVAITGTVKNCLSVFITSNNQIMVTWNENAAGLKFNKRNLDLTELTSTTVIDATATAINNVTIRDTTSGDFTIYYDIYNADPTLTYIKSCEVVSDTADTPEVFMRSVGLVSKGFNYDNNFYLHVSHDSTLQPTYFIVRDDKVIVSKSLYQLGGGLPDGYTLPETPAVDDDTFIMYHAKVGRLDTDSTTIKTRTGISISQIDFTGSNLGIQSVELGKQLHIAGGIVVVYDGGAAVEEGFHLYPETLSATNAASGGSLTNGTRQYVAVYEWIDQRGDFYRSSPSIPLSVTLSGGGSSQKTTITYPTLRLTAKENVTITIYRTVDAGTIFYRVSSIDSPLTNDKTADTGTFVDTYTDASIQDNEILYTTGGILDNIAPPPCSIVASYNNRLFMAGTEDKNQVHYTKPYSQQTGIEYNDTFYFQVERQGGDITALATMDDKLIIFKENSIYYIKGNGPTNAGLNNDLVNPQQIISDVGCSRNSPNSVINTPLGLMFKSTKGIYLLDRSLGTKYIGAPVQHYNDSKVVASVLQGDSSEVRLFTDTNYILVYNYYYDQWSVFTNIVSPIGATVIGGTQYWAETTGQVYKQAEHFNSAGRPIKQKIVTGWFAFNQPQGFQRVYEIALLGKFKSDHKLRVKLYYDYKDTVRETFTIDADTLFDSQPLGNETLLGDNEVLGGTDLVVYQFKLKPAQQKCQSIKISIEDVFPQDIGEGFELSNIHFSIGIKPQAVHVSNYDNDITGDD